MFGFSAFAEVPFTSLPIVSSGGISVDLTETLTVSDGQIVSLDALALLTESVSATDIQLVGTISNVDVSETLTATDTQTATASLIVAVLEPLTAIDEQFYGSSITADLAEALTALDAQTYTLGYSLAITI
jgi:hypothetical protein